MWAVPLFGENLTRLREAAHLTQDALAAALGLKRATTISQLEHRQTPPRPRTVKRLADALGCAPADLLEDVPSPYDGLKTSPVTTPAEHPPQTPEETTMLNADEQLVLACYRKLPEAKRLGVRRHLLELVSREEAEEHTRGHQAARRSAR